MSLILDGQLNKQIADRLGIAIRTVEVHRARVLQKTGARNSVELARMKARLD
jgi:two-component system response regulator DctR